MTGRLETLGTAFRCALTRRGWLLRCAGGALLAASASGMALAEEEKVYRVGVVPQFDSRKMHDIWVPLLAELQTRTGLKLQLVSSPNIPAFEEQFGYQQLDFAYMNPYHALVASANYVPLVRDVATPLEGIIVVRKDGPIQDLRGLQGQTVAFPAPNALAASLMTRAHLDQLGVTVVPHFVKTHTSVYLMVALGRDEAGGGVMQTLEEQPAEVRARLRVVVKTKAVASHPLVAHGRVSAADRERVRAALLAMGETAQGRALLSKVPIDRVGAASADDYAPLRQLGVEKFYVPN